MMSEKAKFFGDIVTRRNTMASSDPTRHEDFGHSVPNFNQEHWEQHRCDIVVKGNLAKFLAPSLRQQLVDTGGKFLAEASPHDPVWGIGFRTDDMRAFQPPRWPALNLLGNILNDDPPPA